MAEDRLKFANGLMATIVPGQPAELVHATAAMALTQTMIDIAYTLRDIRDTMGDVQYALRAKEIL